VVKYDPQTPCDRFAALCLAGIKKKCARLPAWLGSLGPDDITLKREDDDTELPLQAPGRIDDVLADKADLYLCQRAITCRAKGGGTSRTTRPIQPARAGVEEAKASSGGSSSDPSQEEGLSRRLVQQADGMAASLRYRDALKLYREAERLWPGNKESLVSRMKLHERIGQIEPARDCAQRILDLPSFGSDTHELTVQLSRYHLLLREYDEAARVAQSVVRMLGREFDESNGTSSKSLKLAVANSEHPAHKRATILAHAQSCFAEALIHSPDPQMYEMGVRTLERVLEVLPNHTETLLAYGGPVAKHGTLQGSLALILRGVTTAQNDKRLKARFGELLREEGAMAALSECLPRTEDAVPAYAFLATLAKDVGQIADAIDMLQFCVDVQPGDASYALNLVHLYEIEYQAGPCIKAVKRFLRERRDARLGAGAHGIDLGELLAVLEEHEAFAVFEEDVPPESAHGPASFHALQSRIACDPSLTCTEEHLHWLTTESKVEHAALVERSEGGDATPAQTEQVTAERSGGVELADWELNALAVVFTMVKIMYLCGAFRCLPRVISVIERLRIHLEVPLHYTTIRNEAAYYGCISQVLGITSQRADQLSKNVRHEEASSRPLYVCGDSHSLSPAWSELEVAGQRRLLLPRLVTGLKHWHLRKESTFYPKYHFSQAMESIPEGSDVLMIFGEIDCREGILLAVEKGRYESVEEGIRKTLSVFFKKLKALLRSKKFRVFLHPVLPVLPQTRSMVLKYNRQFEEMARSFEGAGRVHWLDFAGDLLEETAAGLRKEFVLDGTHIHPEYLFLVEKAISLAA